MAHCSSPVCPRKHSASSRTQARASTRGSTNREQTWLFAVRCIRYIAMHDDVKRCAITEETERYTIRLGCSQHHSLRNICEARCVYGKMA
eukprot:6214847-Pleurochrysis_carterae.AAC.13